MSLSFGCVVSSESVAVVGVFVGFNCCLFFAGTFSRGYPEFLLLLLALFSIASDLSVKFVALCSGLRRFWFPRLVALCAWVVRARQSVA